MTFSLHPARGWRDALPPSLSSHQKYWLLRPGALTAGLRQLGQVRLRVLREYPQGAPNDEAHGMSLAARTPCWVREVCMEIDDVDCVVARSLTPLKASHGVWQGMRKLRTRPLADMLYNDPSIHRSAFVCSALRGPQAFAATPMQVLEHRPHALWARCSVFWRQGQPLLVTECFLPAFWARLKKRDQPGLRLRRHACPPHI